jgi:hypothetical protein
MPKKRDEPTVAACHGCALVTEVDDDGLCEGCAARRAEDPVITVRGRSLPLSEMKRQIEAGDVELKAAFEGDTVQEQIKAAHADASTRAKAD